MGEAHRTAVLLCQAPLIRGGALRALVFNSFGDPTKGSAVDTSCLGHEAFPKSLLRAEGRCLLACVLSANCRGTALQSPKSCLLSSCPLLPESESCPDKSRARRCSVQRRQRAADRPVSLAALCGLGLSRCLPIFPVSSVSHSANSSQATPPRGASKFLLTAAEAATPQTLLSACFARLLTYLRSFQRLESSQRLPCRAEVTQASSRSCMDL